MKTNEQGHRKMIEEACEFAMKKLGVQKGDIAYLMGGDLVNQMTPTNFAARDLEIPLLDYFRLVPHQYLQSLLHAC